jgi:hypothetical protein
MGFVALAALDFWAVREMYNVESRSYTVAKGGMLYRVDHVESRSSLVAKGAMPMSNVLVVGLLIRHRRPRSRRFLTGFVVAGAMALAVYVAMASLFYNKLVYGPYLGPVYALFFGPKGITRSFQPPLGVYYLALAVWLTLPQSAFALVGGLFFRAVGNLRAASPNRC